MRLRTTIIASLIAMAMVVPVNAASLVRSIRDLPAFVPGEVLVKFKAGRPLTEREAAVRSLGTLRADRRLPFDKVMLSPDLTVEKALESLRADPSVEWAQPNHRFYALCSPADAYYADNTWPWLSIEAPAGWDLAVAPGTCPGTVPGSASVTVAVIDSGVYTAHPDIAPALAAPTDWHNSLDQTNNVPDEIGHGTFVSGIIGANWDGPPSTPTPHPAPCGVAPPFQGGVAGLAGDVTILPVKVLDAEGYGTTEAIVDGLDYAVAKGAKVLNLSLGGPQFEQAEKDAIDRAIAAGCIVVAAAGNESGPLFYPAAYPPVVAVGASGPGNQVATYSNRGPNLDLVAPGGAGTATSPAMGLASEILSALMCPTPADYFQHPNGDSHYGTGAGTSFATPFVSGAAALLWSKYPSWTARQVVERLLSSTGDIGTPGWDPASGYGLLNLRRALAGETEMYHFSRTFNSPNPFYPVEDVRTNITLVLDAPTKVVLDIRDAAGNQVLRRIFAANELNANPVNPQYKSFFVSWDGKNGFGRSVVSGVYPYTVKAGGSVGRNKIVVIQGRR